MIYSNLMGTTSDVFKVGADGKGQIWCNNTYDLFWAGDNPKGGSNPNVTQLGFGTDLNNIRIPGQYFAQGMTNEYPNCPTSYGFIMTVEPTGGITYPNYVTQRLYDTSGNLYVRTSNGLSSSWVNWKQMAYKSDVPIESGTFSIKPTDSRVRLANSSGNYNRVGKMVFIKIETLLTIVNNSPVVDIEFKSLPYLCEVNKFMYGSCSMSYYPISPTIFSYGNIIEVGTSYDAFRIRFTVPINSSGVIHLDSSAVFGNLVKVDTTASLTGGFWYQTV